MEKAILVSQATYGYLTYNLTNYNLYFKEHISFSLLNTNECCNHLTQHYVQEK